MTKNIAILLASGTGNRFNSSTPKQYLSLHGKPIIYYSINTFLNNPLIDYVLPVINKNHINLYTNSLLKTNILNNSKLLPAIYGGEERYHSVKNALTFLNGSKYKPNNVLVHDCARPFVSNNLISTIVNGITEQNGIIPVLKISDSLKSINNNHIVDIINRDTSVLAQTPQGFPFTPLLHCYMHSNTIQTDDSEVYRSMGNNVLITNGNILNSKITNQEDYKMLEKLTTMPQYKIGQGFDVHKLVEGRDLYLCGVKIPHHLGLLGHSDADVAMHALVDAILGALGLGDIGVHFPPSEKKWLNASSSIFLTKCKELLTENNAVISNIDLTIICEEPKITPHVAAMKLNIANILQIDQSCINIKATTTETLGFCGRKEGIASLSSVCLLVNKHNIA